MFILWTILKVLCFLSVSEVFSLVSNESYEIVFKGATGTTYSVHGTSLVITCNKKLRTVDDFPPSNSTLSFKSVTIVQCLPKKYVNKFKVLNINITSIDSLHLKLDLEEPLSPENYTEELMIQNLSIENKNYEYILQNTPNFFEPLSNLRYLKVKGLEIPPLSEGFRLMNLTLSDGSSITEWGNCGYLERFHLSSYTKLDFPKWPQNCTRLAYLEIDHLLPETALFVAERMQAAAPHIYTLKITNCRLYNLPVDMLRSATNMVHLDLSDNVLYDNLFWTFPTLEQLKTLDLSRNLIRGEYGVGNYLTKLPLLKKLFLRDENNVYNVCYAQKDSIKSAVILPLQNSSLESLDFGKTYTYLDCFEDTHFSKLRQIKLYQAVSVLGLELLKMPVTDAGHLEIDLGPSTFREITFTEADYETLLRENSTSPYTGRNLTILMRYTTCDCNHGWLARALRDFPHIISMPDIRCNHENGNPILEELEEHLECNMTGRDGCFYRQYWRDGTVIGECSEWFWSRLDSAFATNLSYPLYGLNVSGQEIATLHSKLPDTLQWLDLRRNRISRGNPEQAAALFAGGKRVWLADNLLLCDCDNRPLLDAIQQHQYQVPDYNLLKCVGTGEDLSSISTGVLCQVAQTVSLSAAAALTLVTGAIAVLLRRYGEHLRMFLFSRGWCLSCLQRPDHDDKPYDAFISFAHDDREYVMNTLLPGLEEGPERFRVCVHYRDWLVGDWIPAQIMRSVQLSKRTLIVLSRSFVSSTWSTFEFRYSITNADENPNANVLVLIKDDVLEMKLDVELRSYLTYNTYLSCDDPWFWEKLRYAMPHRAKNTPHKLTSADGSVGGEEMCVRGPNNAITFPQSADNTQEIAF